VVNKINLMPHASTPAKIIINGNVTLAGLNNSTATIAKGSGSGTSGSVDLAGATRSLNVSSGSAFVNATIDVPISNGGLNLSGSGTLQLTAANTYSGGTTIGAGTLIVSNTTGSATGTGPVTVNGSLLGPGTISGVVTVNAAGLICGSLNYGTITLNSAPVLNGVVYSQIDRNGGSPRSSKIALTSGTLTYSGQLQVDNVGATLSGGETFTLFSAPAYTGAFSSTFLPTVAPGLNWYLGNLTVNGTIKVNRKPSIVTTLAFTNQSPNVLQIPFSSLVGTGTDPDADALSVLTISATSTNGIVLSTNGNVVNYSNNNSVADQFSYTLTDNHGATVSGVVNITNIAAPNTSAQFAGPAVFSNNTLTINYTANGGTTYYMDRSTNLPAWTTIYTNTAPTNGTYQFIDDFHDIGAPVSPSFYRLHWTQE
jgi:autotransporter-associated beta strand protein